MRQIARGRGRRRSRRRLFLAASLGSAVLVVVAAVPALADDPSTGRFSQEITHTPAGDVTIYMTPHYALVKHPATDTTPGYVGLEIGAEAGKDWRVDCSRCAARGFSNWESVWDGILRKNFGAWVIYEDASQTKESPLVWGTRALGPQPGLGGGYGLEVRLPPGARRIVKVEAVDYVAGPFARTFPGPGKVPKVYAWPLDLPVASAPDLVAGAVPPGGATKKAGATPVGTTRPGDPDSPGDAAAIAAAAALLALLAALFGGSVGEDVAQNPIPDGLDPPPRPAWMDAPRRSIPMPDLDQVLEPDGPHTMSRPADPEEQARLLERAGRLQAELDASGYSPAGEATMASDEQNRQWMRDRAGYTTVESGGQAPNRDLQGLLDDRDRTQALLDATTDINARAIYQQHLSDLNRYIESYDVDGASSANALRQKDDLDAQIGMTKVTADFAGGVGQGAAASALNEVAAGLNAPTSVSSGTQARLDAAAADAARNEVYSKLPATSESGSPTTFPRARPSYAPDAPALAPGSERVTPTGEQPGVLTRAWNYVFGESPAKPTTPPSDPAGFGGEPPAGGPAGVAGGAPAATHSTPAPDFETAPTVRSAPEPVAGSPASYDPDGVWLRMRDTGELVWHGRGPTPPGPAATPGAAVVSELGVGQAPTAGPATPAVDPHGVWLVPEEGPPVWHGLGDPPAHPAAPGAPPNLSALSEKPTVEAPAVSAQEPTVAVPAPAGAPGGQTTVIEPPPVGAKDPTVELPVAPKEPTVELPGSAPGTRPPGAEGYWLETTEGPRWMGTGAPPPHPAAPGAPANLPQVSESPTVVNAPAVGAKDPTVALPPAQPDPAAGAPHTGPGQTQQLPRTGPGQTQQLPRTGPGQTQALGSDAAPGAAPPPAAENQLPPRIMRDQFGQVVFGAEPMTPAEHAVSIEVRNLNIDKQLGAGVPAGSTGDYAVPMQQIRAADIQTLRSQGPDFWNSIRDPQTRAYLERLRDSADPTRPLS